MISRRHSMLLVEDPRRTDQPSAQLADSSGRGEAEKNALAEKLAAPDLLAVAITTTYYMSPLPLLEIVAFIREHNPACKIVVGGPYIYSLYLAKQHTGIFRSVGADYYIVSQYGEVTLVRLLDALRARRDVHEIANLAYRLDGTYAMNGMDAEAADIEADPVDWMLFGAQIGPIASVRSAVSCPFSCAFCGFPTRGGAYRTTTVASVESELDQLRRIGGVRAIQFIDDTFNIPPARFKELLRMMIRKQYGFRWNCQFRCQYADRETIELMKESGCEGVFLGIEAANDGMLSNMNKHVTVEQYYRGVELLNSVDITSHANFIIGYPGETEQSYQDIRTFLRQARPSFFRAQLWYCDPTTPVWNEREKYSVRGRGFQWSHRTMDAKEAQNKVHDLFLTSHDATWTPQYNFEFYGVLQLVHGGHSLPNIHRAIRAFNDCIRVQIGGIPIESASPDTVRNSLSKQEGYTPSVDPSSRRPS
jgi:anaerobic magnesium-protoporphyrin IX monomethyl ester cyclase